MVKFIILAAGEGTRLRPYTLDKPKCLIDIHGKSLLDWQIDIAKTAGIKDIIVIKGYLQEKIKRDDVRYYVNKDYNTTNMVETLWCANAEFNDDVIVSYGDILYEKEVLEKILKSNYDISVIVDKKWRSYWEKRFANPLNDAESLKTEDSGKITSIGQKVKDILEINGQYIGLMKFNKNGINDFINVYKYAEKEYSIGNNPFNCNRPFKKLFMTDMLQGIIDLKYTMFEVPIERKWVEVDSVSDYKLALELIEIKNNSLIIK